MLSLRNSPDVLYLYVIVIELKESDILLEVGWFASLLHILRSILRLYTLDVYDSLLGLLTFTLLIL